MRMAAIYARVSSEQQREENTIASQTASLIKFAKNHDLEVPEEWVFEDEGYSGATLERPGLERVWGFRRRRTLIPEGTRTAFRAEGEQFSERSDAGTSIVQEVFGFVKKDLSGAQRRKRAASEERGAGKGRHGLSPPQHASTRRASARRLGAGAFLTHGVSTHLDAMGVVD